MANGKAQVWFTDFAVAIVIFSLVLISYYTYTTNISKQDSVALDDMISDSKLVSSSLLSEGFPGSWDNYTVQRVGITNNGQKADDEKVFEFGELPYNRTKSLMGTQYEYIVFFLNQNGTLVNINGVCRAGMPLQDPQYDVKAAYMYGSSDDSFLKDFMVAKLNADVYLGDNGFDTLISKIDDYDFIVIEHSSLSASTFNNGKSELEGFVSDGGILMMSGQVAAQQNVDLANVRLRKKSGQSESDRNATVVAEDKFLSLKLGDWFLFSQAYYATDQSAQDFTPIMRFNNDNNIAIVRWSYGNGKAFYFSDFDTNLFDGDFVSEVTKAAKKWGNFRCRPINISNIPQYDNLVKTERLLAYNSRPVRMVLYLWQ